MNNSCAIINNVFFFMHDKDQSTELFTSISNGFAEISGAMSDYRNDALKFWNEQGGREAVLNGLLNIVKQVGKVLGPIYESYKKIIDPWNTDRLMNISKSFENWTSKIKLSDTAIDNISRTFDGLFTLLSMVGKAIGGVVGAFMNLIPLAMPIVEGILSITAPLGDFIVELNETVKATGFFQTAFETLSKIVSNVANAIGDGLKTIGSKIGSITKIDLSGLGTFAEKIVSSFTPLEWVGNMFDNIINSIVWLVEKITPVMSNLATIVWDTLTNISKAIMDTIGGDGTAITNLLNTGLIGAIIIGIKKLFDVIKDAFENSTGILDSISEVLDGVKGSLEAFQNGIKADTLKKIAVSIAILAGALIAISLVDSGKLISSLTAMGVMFAELVGAMAVLDKIGGGAKVGASVVILATSIAILAGALNIIADLKWNELFVGLTGLAGMLTMMVVASKTLETNSKGMFKSAAAMVVFAAAIKVLATVVDYLSQLKPDELAQGLIGVGVLLTELALFLKVTDLSGMSIGKSVGILILAGALNVLSIAVDKLGSIDTNTLIQGLIGIGVVLTEIGLFMKLIGNPKGIVSTSIGITILAGALIIMSKAVESMGSLDGEVIGKGLVGIGAGLLIIAGAMTVMPKNILMQAVALTVISAALLIMGNAIQNMGSMSWEEIGKGLLMLAGSLTILTVAMMAMSGALAGAAAMIVMAGALMLLTPCLIMLGKMKMDEIGRSLLVLAGAFTIVGVAGLVLGPVIPVLLGLAAAIALLGAGCLAVGVGLTAFATGQASTAATAFVLAIVYTVVIAVSALNIATMPVSAETRAGLCAIN